ncbi:hypothetical protein RhiirC2_832902 [Rhizophagus irregularis]|uniref:Uncharacterized protein n=1 Tax=Rhizophagus irregularis TaxID=588596 RepID=A0A2N1N4V6_9GLOM|nr:hypothetical protein RhiirC2_832902 [Rhizophagus irregularis]
MDVDTKQDIKIFYNKELEENKILHSLFPLLYNKISIMESKYESIQITDEYAFGILDGSVWKIELENHISKIKLSFQDSDIKNFNNKINEGTYKHLNIYLFNIYKDKMHELFQEVSKSKNECFIHLSYEVRQLIYNPFNWFQDFWNFFAEIELFYMLSYQRRNNDWFPEVMYYHASLDDTQKEVKKMIKRDEWDQINAFPKSKQDLLKKINIQHNPDN